MPIHNAEIADVFATLADLLEIEGSNPFRVRAYREAARTIRGYGKSMADLVDQGEDLSRLANIGNDIAEKIGTIVQTGTLPLLEEVEERTPATLSKLMQVEGLGPKRVKRLYKELNVQSVEDLQHALDNGRVEQLSGFGTKTAQTIRQHLQHVASRSQRTRLVDAEEIADALVAYLERSKGVKSLSVAGSYRRRKETVGDLDILATAKKDTTIMRRFVDYDEVDEVQSQGKSRSTVILRSGLQVDLRVVPEVSYGAAMHYFTGSKAHNIAVRKLGVGKKLKINEYGVFKGDRRIAGKTEEEVYDSVGLHYVPPELREDRGEIDAARNGKLPVLIDIDDIAGDLHCHTRASDGHAGLEEMVQAAHDHGYQYVSINDHSKRLTVAHGLDKKRLLGQIKAIDELNEKLDGMVVLKSIEVDILEDGTLDLPDSVLKELDFTVCSVHSKFDLPRDKQTERVLRAMDNPRFTVFAHPSGRLIQEREAYAIDLERIMEGARERGCFLEVNAHPERLDLDDIACKMAKDTGVKLAISTDAHSTSDLDLMRFGVDQGRRGWLEPEDVINTRDLKTLRRLFDR